MAAKSNSLSLVHWLVNKGAILNARDEKWNTPLHLAAQVGDKNMVKPFLNEYVVSFRLIYY